MNSQMISCVKAMQLDDQFYARLHEVTDQMYHATMTNTVSITAEQLEHYGKNISDVLVQCKELMMHHQESNDPDPFDSGHWSWKVWATKVGDKYRITFRQVLDLTV